MPWGREPWPIVQTGLSLDDQGIPLSIEEFPGNTLDAQTLKDAMRRTVDNFEMGRFILVADRGMYSGINFNPKKRNIDIPAVEPA